MQRNVPRDVKPKDPAPPFAWIDAADVERHLDYPSLFRAIETAFLEHPAATPRVSLPYRGERTNGTLLLMSALLPDTLGCVKVITYDVSRASGAIKYIYVAFDPVSGATIALIDGEALSTRRTAAVSVAAARQMATKAIAHILVVGTGPVARELISAYGAAYPGATLELWGRRRAAVRAIIDDHAHTAAVLEALDLDDSVRRADIVSCATGSSAPLIKGALLQPWAHVDLIGGFTPLMREADDEVFHRAAGIVVDNPSALTEAGDLCQPIAAGIVHQDRVVTLETLFGARPQRRGDEQITLFKSVGNSIFDLATTRLLLDQMRLGRPATA